ncbi:hypothetical protein FE810_11670 [Thalassotalea litorea]|uniref:Prenyltransferase n=1 Tax=Thalassotalea litorea TaxID=2020715 RepID=A0A5R9ILY3_9GAMM|nr:hypothetical protein [Thalassotalea litorea]TLU64261.1 hypothetical protein FE810_11670 [Thalassotalea litorea]
MSLYPQLLLGAIRPRSLFLPCSAIILGSGLAAYDGFVDGRLFTSLLFITMLGQIVTNLASDYQRAFIIHASQPQSRDQSVHHQHIQSTMLKLILGLFILFCAALGALTFTSTAVAPVSMTLMVVCCLLLLSVLRHKTRRGLPADRFGQIGSLAIMAMLSAILPFFISHYLHTANVQITDVLIAAAAGCLALMNWFSEQITLRLSAHESLRLDSDGEPLVKSPPAIANLLNAQTIALVVAVLCTVALIVSEQLPLLCFAFIFTIPSLAATIITTRHLPDSETAQSQMTKTGIASFSYWVLFIIGLMW